MFFWKKKKKVAIYTAIFGRYDSLHEPIKIIHDADLFCFTDQDFTSQNWNIIKVSPFDKDNLTLSARKYKVLGDPLVNKYEYTIWVDGSMTIIFDSALNVVKKYLNQTPIAVFKHHEQNSIYEEADYLLNRIDEKKYGGKDKIQHQIAEYRKEGLPKNSGLIASGFIIRKWGAKKLHDTMDIWWNELRTESIRDQLSFNYATWRTGLKYDLIEGGIFSRGDLIVIEKHTIPNKVIN